jgi:hypothetical protein
MKKALRPTIQLRPAYLRGLEGALTENPMVKASIQGIYEGRQLDGLYRLVIDGARLVPTEAPENPT